MVAHDEGPLIAIEVNDAARREPPAVRGDDDPERAAIVCEPPRAAVDTIEALRACDRARLDAALCDLRPHVDAAAHAITLDRIRTATAEAEGALARGDTLRIACIAREARALMVAAEPNLVLGARPLDVAEIFAPLPDTPWVVRALQWAPGRPSQIQGAGGAGKSYAVYAAALALATGRPVWGRFQPSRENVRTIVLDYDGGGAQRRLQRLAAGMRIDPNELSGKLRIVSRAPVRLSTFKMEDGSTRSAAVDAFVAVVDGWDMCVVDALRGIVAGVDENDSRIRDFLDVLGDVSARTGCTFVFLHHSGKGAGEKARGERGRGSSAIQDGSGSVLCMAEAEGHASTFSAEITRDHEARDAPRTEPFYLRIVDVPLEGRDVPGLVVEYRTAEQAEGAPVDQIDTKRRDLFRRIVAFVASSPGADVAAVKGALGLGNSTASDAIGALLSPGFGALVDHALLPDYIAKPGAKATARSLYLADGVDPDTWEPAAVKARRASGGRIPCSRCKATGEWRDRKGRAGTCGQCGGEGRCAADGSWVLPREELVTYPDRSADDDR